MAVCGITGFVQTSSFPYSWEHVLASMANQIAYRGPDSEGVWVDKEFGIGLAHRRLAVVDLSPEGHQPMISPSGRYVIVFNGEVYNFRILMNELIKLGHQFRGHSDTEIILASIEQWGVKNAVTRFIGMFAIALWDRKTRYLYLIRDRMGEKPLYYGKIGKSFAFGSELKALQAHPQWEGLINHNAIGMFVRNGYVPAPASIFNGINKLRPGAILTIDFTQADAVITDELYWSMDNIVYEGQMNPIKATEEEMITSLESMILDSIGQQMIADVPLGAFLSGGIDSTTIVALMQSIASQPVKTFTIGFEYAEFNEADYARKIADFLGTHHTELYVTADEALAVIPKLPIIYDEPFADSSQIPTFLVSELTRRHVTVSLSGDAGDELFCGYSRYFLVNDLWKKISWLPASTRQILAKLLLNIPTNQLDQWFNWLTPLFNKYGHSGKAGDKLKKAALLLNAKDSEQFYSLLTANWVDMQGLLNMEDYHKEYETNVPSKYQFSKKEFVSQMMFTDTMRYLPDDILVKVDRATMAHSLESRVPLLDHRIVEYAWRLPLSVKYNHGKGKWILRQVLNKYIPKNLVERPKMGFGVPMQEWLKGPLREWAEELLNENRLRQEGYFNPALVRKKWLEHLNGKRNWKSQIWGVLVFQAWLEHNNESDTH